MSRRAQFNISALRFSDEVHAFLEKLSMDRKLSEWLATQVELEIRHNGMPTGSYSCSNVMDELKEIKQLLVGGCFKPYQVDIEVEEPKPVMEQISSDSINQLILESDLEYGF
jgi:hypothetical protein